MSVRSTPPVSDRPAFSGPPTRASASGPLPYRGLLVGSRTFTHDAALSGAVAEALALLTGHGVDIETAPAEPLAQAADGTLLRGRDLARIDAVVVVVDPEHTRRAVPHALESAGALIEDLGARLVAGSTLVVVVPSPLVAGLTRRQLDDITAGIREIADALTPVIRLEDGAAGTTGAERWADVIAGAIAAGLTEPMVGFLPDDHYDEDLRLDAVDRLPRRDGLWVARFQHLVDEARLAYGTAAAALSIVDADHTRYGVAAGFENKVVKRGQTICNRVLRTYGGLIVGDAQADLRFQKNPDVRSGEVRFYAGYRIESLDGAPLGSLCVFDPNPREVGEEDLASLRDLAVTVQRSIWAMQHSSAPAA